MKALERHEQTVTAEIIHSKSPISSQDEATTLGTLIRMATPSEASPSDKSDNTEGSIIEVRDNRLNIGEQDIVYIDRGRKDGIFPGHQFEIIHGGQSASKTPLPKRIAGRLVVLSAQDQTSTAQIIESTEPISKGDPLRFLPKK